MNYKIEKLTEKHFNKAYELSFKYSFLNVKNKAECIYRPINKQMMNELYICLNNQNAIGLIQIKALNVNDLVNTDRDYDVKNSAYIGKIVIDENYRGQGIGQMLLDYVIKNSNAKNFYTQIRVSPEPNIASKNLVEKVGFKFCSKKEFYVEDYDDRAVWGLWEYNA